MKIAEIILKTITILFFLLSVFLEPCPDTCKLDKDVTLLGTLLTL